MWDVAFRVTEGQDRDERFEEVLEGSNVNAAYRANGDVDRAKNVAFEIIDEENFNRPYSVHLKGNRMPGGEIVYQIVVRPA